MSDIKPDPSMIGGVPTPPLVILPRPARLFADRAARFDLLAADARLGSYLRFLAGISRIQSALCDELPPVAAPEPEKIEMARSARMPILDRHALRSDPALDATLTALTGRARDLEMPAPARLALDAVIAAGPEDRPWMFGNVLDDAIPTDSAAPHLFAAAAAQLHLARLAATLTPDQPVAIRTGVCPCCGGRPAASMVTGVMGAEGARYAACAVCQTQWNEVRVKCLNCGSTKGIGYQVVENVDNPTIKAETCDECGSWVKQMMANLNPSLDPIADDVASVGLEMLMQGGAWARKGVNPFLVGY